MIGVTIGSCSFLFFFFGFDHYAHHGSLLIGKRPRKSKYILWHVVTWSIWLLRNMIIFSGGTANFNELLYCIKLWPWNWFLAKSEGVKCSFSDWCHCHSPISIAWVVLLLCRKYMSFNSGYLVAAAAGLFYCQFCLVFLSLKCRR